MKLGFPEIHSIIYRKYGIKVTCQIGVHEIMHQIEMYLFARNNPMISTVILYNCTL